MSEWWVSAIYLDGKITFCFWLRGTTSTQKECGWATRPPYPRPRPTKSATGVVGPYMLFGPVTHKPMIRPWPCVANSGELIRLSEFQGTIGKAKSKPKFLSAVNIYRTAYVLIFRMTTYCLLHIRLICAPIKFTYLLTYLLSCFWKNQTAHQTAQSRNYSGRSRRHNWMTLRKYWRKQWW